jgi:hypothetical protein
MKSSPSSLILLLFVVNWFPCESLFLVSTLTKQPSNHSNDVLNSPQSSRVKSVVYTSYSTSLASTSEGSAYSDAALSPRKMPKIVYFLNAGTKWAVSAAVTVGVFWNPRRFQGPYIVVGSIAANYLAAFLKKIFNQGRPEGAPFTDPGMPSSHALVSFFVAMAWDNALGGVGRPFLIASALTVSTLRVLCGYHTLPQIAVGGTLGTLLGHAWMSLGFILEKHNGRGAFAFSWSAYLVGSAFYIYKNLGRWLTDEKYL